MQNHAEEIVQPTLLSPILTSLEANEGAGLPLRYDAIYDDIKEARREDNEQLSRGIWTTALKRADFSEVERLCINALSTQSKDLQIMGWLMEAWLILNGLKGGAFSMQMLDQFCRLFWHITYPQVFDNDFEERINIFDWIDKTLQNRLLFIEITPVLPNIDLRALNLSDWIEAVNFDKIVRRSPDSQALLADAETSGKVTLARFRRGLSLMQKRSLEVLYADALSFLAALTDFQDLSQHLFPSHVPVFTGTRDNLDALIRIVNSALELRANEQSTPKDSVNITDTGDRFGLNDSDSPSMNESEQHNASSQNAPEIIAQRADAYRAIHELGKFLMEIDPHSPAPYLLELIVAWEDKKLLQIVSDINEGKSEAHNLLRMLAGNGAR